LEVDLFELVCFHRAHGGQGTMAVREVKDASRYGTVQIAGGGRVTGFLEKTGKEAPGLINAGVYVFDPAIFESIPQGPSTLERDVFPNILARGVYALEQSGIFIDIGIPEDYARARAACDQLFQAAVRRRDASGEPNPEGR